MSANVTSYFKVPNTKKNNINPYFKVPKSNGTKKNTINPYFNNVSTYKNNNNNNTSIGPINIETLSKNLFIDRGAYGVVYFDPRKPGNRTKVIKVHYTAPSNTLKILPTPKVLGNIRNINAQMYENMKARYTAYYNKYNKSSIVSNNTPIYAIMNDYKGISLLHLQYAIDTQTIHINDKFIVTLLESCKDLLANILLNDFWKNKRGHYDIHSGNILVKNDGTLTLIDYDLAGTYEAYFKNKHMRLSAVPIYYLTDIKELFDDECNIVQSVGNIYIDSLLSNYPNVYDNKQRLIIDMCKAYKTAMTAYTKFFMNENNKKNTHNVQHTFKLTKVVPYIDTFSLGHVFIELFITVLYQYSKNELRNTSLLQKCKDMIALGKKMATHDITKQMTPEKALAEIKLIIADMLSTK